MELAEGRAAWLEAGTRQGTGNIQNTAYLNLQCTQHAFRYSPMGSTAGLNHSLENRGIPNS